MYSSSQGCHNTTGTHVPHGIIQCYLPPGRGDIPALTPAEAGTQLSDPGGMQGWVDLVVYILPLPYPTCQWVFWWIQFITRRFHGLIVFVKSLFWWHFVGASRACRVYQGIDGRSDVTSELPSAVHHIAWQHQVSIMLLCLMFFSIWYLLHLIVCYSEV